MIAVAGYCFIDWLLLGRLLPVAKGSKRPILLKKSVCPNCLIIDW
ncbi:hypothetical protein PGR6_34920 [Pseudomonas sp. GR 6-02]|nr:hypothetical protein PGR6_34920 [Pseudomonas sp. GR 6-02]